MCKQAFAGMSLTHLCLREYELSLWTVLPSTLTHLDLRDCPFRTRLAGFARLAAPLTALTHVALSRSQIQDSESDDDDADTTSTEEDEDTDTGTGTDTEEDDDDAEEEKYVLRRLRRHFVALEHVMLT
jgi:hypothetical protein